MAKLNPAHYVKIAAMCLVAAGLNSTIHPILVPGFGFPLFVDTVFTAAVTFYAGLIPGLATALLTWITGFAIKDDIVTPFVLCSLAEVVLIFLLKPEALNIRGLDKVDKSISLATVLGQLLILYSIACVAASILGGFIDYVFYTALPNTKPSYSAEDTFKELLLQGPLPVPVMNIFSRLPVNLIDRFIVIAGGYFISLALIKLRNRAS